MRYSDQTIADCNLLPEAKGNKSIFDFFNRTRTAGGAMILEEMLTDKKNSVDEIVAIQEAINYASGHISQLDLFIHNTDITYLGEYFRLNLDLKSNETAFNMFLRFSLSKNPTFLFIKSNIIRLAIFLKDTIKLSRIENGSLPLLIKNIISDIRACLNEPPIQDLLKRDIQQAGVGYFLKFDIYLRNEFQEKFNQLLECLFRLDAFVSIAKTALNADLVFPTIGQSKQLKIYQGFHVLIKEPVKNDFNIDDDIKLVFLTGANMSGKSTFFRSVGTIVCLAHSGFPVPAVSAEMPLYDNIGIHISSRDDLAKGYSQFYNEILEVKYLLDRIEEGKQCFAIFDELLSGTNLNDARDCAAIVIGRLNYPGDSLVMISSHNIQLAGDTNYDYVHYNFIETYIRDGKPVFTYKLVPGKNEVRLGLLLFQQLDV
jgi:DNA mismatch repair protein MutS